MQEIEEDVKRIERVWEEKYYEVWVVKFEEMPAMTYGIINKTTGVIENLQPILFNAKTLAKQFSAWLDGGDDPNETALRLMSGSLNS